MPEITCLQVAATAVKKEDRIDDVQLPSVMVKGGKTVYEHGHMVESIKRGTSNITFETTGGRIILAADAEVSVRREVETAEEKEAKRQEMLAVCRADLVKTVDKFVVDAKAGRTSAAEKLDGDWVRSSHVEDFLVANARLEIAKLVEHVMDMARSEGGLHRHEEGVECEYTEPSDNGRGMKCVKPTLPCTDWDGVVAVLEMVGKQMMEAAKGRRALSRSTSVVSNLMEDVKAEQLAKFLDDTIRWNAWGADLPQHVVQLVK